MRSFRFPQVLKQGDKDLLQQKQKTQAQEHARGFLLPLLALSREGNEPSRNKPSNWCFPSKMVDSQELGLFISYRINQFLQRLWLGASDRRTAERCLLWTRNPRGNSLQTQGMSYRGGKSRKVCQVTSWGMESAWFLSPSTVESEQCDLAFFRGRIANEGDVEACTAETTDRSRRHTHARLCSQ